MTLGAGIFVFLIVALSKGGCRNKREYTSEESRLTIYLILFIYIVVAIGMIAVPATYFTAADEVYRGQDWFETKNPDGESCIA